MKKMNSGFAEKRLPRSCSSSSTSCSSRVCECGELVISYISNTTENPRRAFWRCPNWMNEQNCGYFRWKDEPEENLQDGYVAELQKKNAMLIAKLEAQIQKLEAERLNLEVKNARLKQKLEAEAEKLESERKKGKMLMYFSIVCHVISGLWFMALISKNNCNM
ncbi:uncharacterized protein At4g04775-like [Lotus japonicus]|uniref:uncharacterized protein At4g04775-like n=1 Tax=Lotus japonicus TaxID=34305 RepID=UPI002589354A|nr:uncharacterized protein At4g04775-like [Lotus japonicus]